MTDVKALIDCSTGEVSLVPLSEEEKQVRVRDEQEGAEESARHEVERGKANALRAKLKRGEATSDEMQDTLALLLGGMDG